MCAGNWVCVVDFYGELEMSCHECCSSTDPISYCSSVMLYAHYFFAGREDFKAEEASWSSRRWEVLFKGLCFPWRLGHSWGHRSCSVLGFRNLHVYASKMHVHSFSLVIIWGIHYWVSKSQESRSSGRMLTGSLCTFWRTELLWFAFLSSYSVIFNWRKRITENKKIWNIDLLERVFPERKF